MMEDDELDLMLPAKKKKSKKVEFMEEGDAAEKDDGVCEHFAIPWQVQQVSQKVPWLWFFFTFSALEDDESKNADGITFSSQTGPAWAGSERDYTYDEVHILLVLGL